MWKKSSTIIATYIEMLPVIRAGENIEAWQAASLATGNIEKDYGKEVLREWLSRIDGGKKKEKRKLNKQQQEIFYASMGIGITWRNR